MPDPNITPYREEPPDKHGHHRYEVRERRQRSGWQMLGMAVAVCFTLCGLAVVGVVIFLMVAQPNLTGNK